VRRRERMIWLSGRMMLSHLPSGENWMSRAPDEKVLGTETLKTRRMSSSGLRRSWKSLISEFVDTASRLPSEFIVADVMFASPLIRILATSFRPWGGLFSRSSSSSVGSGSFLMCQMCTSRSQKLIIKPCLGALRIKVSCGKNGSERWFSNPYWPSGTTVGEASGPINVSNIPIVLQINITSRYYDT